VISEEFTTSIFIILQFARKILKRLKFWNRGVLYYGEAITKFSTILVLKMSCQWGWIGHVR
jgi:hypothetical protein